MSTQSGKPSSPQIVAHRTLSDAERKALATLRPLFAEVVEGFTASAFTAWLRAAPNANPHHIAELRMKALAADEFVTLLTNMEARKN